MCIRDRFYEEELLKRKKILLPPYCKLIAIILSGTDKSYLEIASYTIKKKLLVFKDLNVLGPIPAPIEYINNKYRFRLLIKSFTNNLCTYNNFYFCVFYIFQNIYEIFIINTI